LVATPEQELSKFKISGFCRVTQEDIQKTQMKVILENLNSDEKGREVSAALKPLEDENLQREIWTIGFKMMHENVNIYIFHSPNCYDENSILPRIQTFEQSYIDSALLKSSI
jgi:hypothetical protein